jgi:hypothetical protein
MFAWILIFDVKLRDPELWLFSPFLHLMGDMNLQLSFIKFQGEKIKHPSQQSDFV